MMSVAAPLPMVYIGVGRVRCALRHSRAHTGESGGSG